MTFEFDFRITMTVVVAVALAIVGWVQTGRKLVNDKLGLLGDRLDRHENRISLMEQTLTELPTKNDIHTLGLALEGLRGDIREVKAAQVAAADVSRRQENVVQRIEEYLLNEGRK